MEKTSSIEMSFPCKSLKALGLCVALIAAQGFGELIVVRHSVNEGDSMRKLTCVSEDDDSALIWNFNPSANVAEDEKHNLANFQPNRPASNDVSACAIWNSTSCVAKWGNGKEKWEVANSAVKPMGPVFDYRWENFMEYTFDSERSEEEYQYVREAKKSGTAVFSVRALREVHVLLCKKKNPTEGPCFWIVIGGSRASRSEIRTCTKGAPEIPRFANNKNCDTLNSLEHGVEEVVHAYEWRTFTINWNRRDNRIEVSRDAGHKNKLLMQGSPDQWHDVSHILIGGEIPTRVRFHFYDYYTTDDKNTELYVEELGQVDGKFCLEMLVGLCPKCGLDINLLNDNGFHRNVGNIYGIEDSTSDDLPAWQSVRLTDNFDTKGLKLQIRTFRDPNSGKGQWAIGSLRTCRSVDGFRESTIANYQENINSAIWKQVNCQKLSYANSAVVNANFIIANNEDASQIQRFVGRWTKSCAPTCPSFDKMLAFCSPAGCTCAQGLMGVNCTKKCSKDYHGYNCDKKCGSCNNPPCDAITGYCSTGCNDQGLLPPLCKAALGHPEIQDIGNTNARVLQKVTLGSDVEVRLWLEIEFRNTTEPFECVFRGTSVDLLVYEANITNLEPNRTYAGRTVAAVLLGGRYSYAKGPKFSFTTTGENRIKVIPSIENLEIDIISEKEVTFKWKALMPDENGVRPMYNISIKLDKLLGCEALNRPTPPKEAISKTVSTATVSFDDLHPYAIYTATIFAYTSISGNPVTKAFETPATNVPTSKISNFHIAKTQLSIEWEKPANCATITGPTNATKLYFEGVGDSIRNWNITKETNSEFFYLYWLHLPPHTRYRVRAHVIRNFNLTENSDIYSEITGWTIPAGPPAVTELEIYEANPNKNTISLRWLPPPNPSNSEIEFYEVSIGNQNDPLRKPKIFKVTEAELSCAKKEDYVCYRNLPLFPKVVTKDTEILVSVKYRHVDGLGHSGSQLRVWDSYFKVRSEPQNLTAIAEDRGTVMLTWTHPSISYIKIQRFRIKAELLKTSLQENVAAHLPITMDYPVLRYDKNYTTKLHLPISSSYRISVIAMNINDLESSQAMVNISIEDDEGFLSDGKLQVSQDGNLIDLQIPGVVNATVNTVVTVTVKGFITCSTKSEKSSDLSERSKWVAAEYKPDKNNPKTLAIRINQNPNIAMDCFLHLGKTYDIIVAIKDRPSVQLATKIVIGSSITLPVDDKLNLTWLIVFPIIVIGLLLLVLLMWYRKRERGTVKVSFADILRKTSSEKLTDNCNRQSSTPPPKILTEERVSHIYAEPFVSDSNFVSLEFFEKYAKESASNGQLNSQYATFPQGLTKPCEYGKLPQNMPKNRNRNLPAYDETRVVLDKIPGDPYSDYINANYIKGYSGDTAYIATQGPKANTINDFWRMMWQKKVRVICMLTNLVEDGKTMCEKYWPEVGSEVQHGQITITTLDRNIFADYTLRTFKLTIINGHEWRKITHLHYTGWPDHGVPMYSQSLVTFLKKIVEILDGHGPLVIHCSEGTGRTGTIVLCDMCIRQGIVEREIDVQAITKRMYESRANMLDNPQQYLLAHVLIAESVMSTTTRLPCTEVLPTRIKTLRKQLPSHVQRLNDTMWQEKALHSLAGSYCNISGNTGLPEVIPVTYEVVQNSLYSGFENESNWVNAVSVDGVRVKEQYLASRLPLPSDLPNFWRYIVEKNIELVVILQRLDPKDPMFCDVMPGDSILVPVRNMQVKTESSVNEEGLYTIDNLLLTDTSESKEKPRQQSLTVITCHEWPCGKEGKPPPPASLVSLWSASENIRQNEDLTLVLCQDGITACGLYLALSFLLERMAVEGECDVISAVRAVRRSKPEFVQSLEQFDYLYDAAVNYVERFQTYANLP